MGSSVAPSHASAHLCTVDPYPPTPATAIRTPAVLPSGFAFLRVLAFHLFYSQHGLFF